MPTVFGTPIEKMSISKLIEQRADWQKKASEVQVEERREYCNEVIEKIDANINRKSQLSVLGQLLDTDYVNVYDETKKCNVYYPIASDVRQDCAAVKFYGEDNRIDSMQTMHVSKVEQYVIDHGFDPNGSWS